MVQIIKNPDLSEILGSSLGSGLSYLANRKLEQIKKHQTQAETKKGLTALAKLHPDTFGKLSEQELTDLATLPEKHLNTYLKQSLQKSLVDFGGGQEKVNQDIEHIISGKPNTNISTGSALSSPEEQNMLKQLGLKLPSQEQIEPDLQSSEDIEAIQKIDKKLVKPNEIEEPKLASKLPPGAIGEQEIQKLENHLAAHPEISATQKSMIRKQIEEREKKYGDQQKTIDKATEKFYEDTENKGKGAEEVNLRLERMLDLVNKGELTGVIPGAILDTFKTGIPYLGIGLDLFGLTSTDTQEFKKLQADMLKSIKDWFGGKITNDEVRRFMDRLPSLNQSNEGKRVVIRDLMLLNQGEIIRRKSQNEIIAEHGGYRPHNLETLVTKRSKPELDNIAKEFKKTFKSPQEFAKEAERNRSLGAVIKDSFIEPFVGENVPQFEQVNIPRLD